jgi:hypothetical protein
LPIEIRSDFGTLEAAGLAREQQLKIEEPHIIRPLIGDDLYRVAAFVV